MYGAEKHYNDDPKSLKVSQKTCTCPNIISC